MNIDVIKVGMLETNCYIIKKDNHALIIDPGDEAKKIIEHVGDLVVDGIVVTHSHFDHIGAVSDLLFKYKTVIYNKSNLKEGCNEISNFLFDVIYVPGHLDDSIVLYFMEDKVMFVGDFIFENSIGRTDLPGGNVIDMKNSLKKILDYKEDVTIYPGHGNNTTLDNERNNLKFYINTL